MTLMEWASRKKTAIFDALSLGQDPPEGEWDPMLLREARTKGAAQMGSTHFEPHAAHFEYIFPDTQSTATVLKVTLPTPARVVYLPVPGWVIEDIWQGEVQGSYHFEEDAARLLEELSRELNPDSNRKWFAPQPAKRRE